MNDLSLALTAQLTTGALQPQDSMPATQQAPQALKGHICPGLSTVVAV